MTNGARATADDDCPHQDIECWERQLAAAGWKPRDGRHIYWYAPDGSLHLGPFGCWKKMRAGLFGTKRDTAACLKRGAGRRL